LDFEIRHSIAGRLRLRVVALLDNGGPGDALAARLKKIEGVRAVRINARCGSVVVEYDRSGTGFERKLTKEVRAISSSALFAYRDHSQGSEARPDHGLKASNADSGDNGRPAGWKPLALATAGVGLCWFEGPILVPLIIALGLYNASPIFGRAYRVIGRERRLSVDVLDSLAIGIATASGRLFTSGVVIWLITLGDWIRDRTAARSRRAIMGLLDYQTRKAWVLRGRAKVEVRVSELRSRDTVVVYAGDMIPADGSVLRGRASVDQKTITGESLPVTRTRGDKVYAATVVREGKLYIRTRRVGAETTAAQIVHMVESAPTGETRVQNYAEKFADRLVPPALSVAGGLYAVTGDTDRLLSMTIVDFGTGIRVAAPTSVLAAMTSAVREGVLIKGGSYMEKLNRIDTIVFDKTGTLTEGRPAVRDVLSYKERTFPPRKILQYAAAAEIRFKHPIAQAVMSRAREFRLALPARQDSHYHIGLGVEARLNGNFVHLGNKRFLRERGIGLKGAGRDVERLSSEGVSSLLLAVDGDLVGILSYSDRLRPESANVIKTLKNRGVSDLVMLTGDDGAVAASVARQLGIEKYFAEILPANKAEIVKELQQHGRTVAMVGDGINDSAALAYADVGIAMKNGADVARETAHVVLMEDNLWRLISAMEISKSAIGLIRQNYAITAGLNAVALALSIPRGLMAPEFTALISNGSAIVATLNALRPIMGTAQ
jgi:heavy metal translocating P-type ATPase